MTVDLSQAQYRKAQASNGADTGCVEVAGNLSEVTAIRDSVRPGAGVHVVTKAVFSAFLSDMKAGAYDM